MCTLVYNSSAFCSSVAFLAIFCIGMTSHRRDSLDSVSALTWFSHSSYLYSSRSSQSRFSVASDFFFYGLVSPTLIASFGHALLVQLSFRHTDVCFLLLLRRFARVLRTCCSAHPNSVLVVHRPSSIVFVLRPAICRCLFSFWSPLALFVVVLCLCLNSLAAHRDLSHLCATRRLLRTAHHFMVVYDSVVRFWPPPGQVQFHQKLDEIVTFHQKLSSKTTFIKIQFQKSWTANPKPQTPNTKP